MSEENPHLRIEELENLVQRLRAEESGFVGLGEELVSVQKRINLDFERGARLKNSADQGSVREDQLRNFLANGGYLPTRYGVNEGSARVISRTGHQSGQIDLLLYDRDSCPRLMSVEDIHYFPVESVYGVISVKSTLRRRETIVDGLDNIASFKRLQKDSRLTRNLGGLTFEAAASTGFGVLFAYDCKMKWETVVQHVKAWQTVNPALTWPNAIVILSQGIILQLSSDRTAIHSHEISAIDKPRLMGLPKPGSSLLQFYLLLMDMLNGSLLSTPNMREYVDLPRVSGSHYYRFTLGPFSTLGELGDCKEHGPFLRSVSDVNINRILQSCEGSERKMLGSLFEAVFDMSESWADFGPEVYVYNPDGRELKDIMALPHGVGLLIELLEINGNHYCIPLFYAVKDEIFTGCPKCGAL